MDTRENSPQRVDDKVTDMDGKDDFTPQKSPGTSFIDKTYATLTKENCETESHYEAIHHKSNVSKTENKPMKYNYFTSKCFPSGKVILCLSAVVIAMIIIILCTSFCIFALIEISRLKSEIASIQQHNSTACDTTTDQCTFIQHTLENQQQLLNLSIDMLNQSYMTIKNRQQLLLDTLLNQFQLPSFALPSCAAVLQLNPLAPSGYYWVKSSNNPAIRVYCDMTRSCGGGVTGGWTRVAHLDMTDPSTQCPIPLREHNKRVCVIDSNSPSCSPVTISTHNLNFSKVCGKIRAYQIGSPDAFGTSTSDISSYYVDGISLTHGTPRRHIWTFAAASDEVGIFPPSNCPCTRIDQSGRATPSPEFVGNDYFCDTGSQYQVQFDRFYLDDPLWDGAGCGPKNTCCSFNNPPWFYKELPELASDNIEMRVCRNQENTNEDIAVETVTIYVQ